MMDGLYEFRIVSLDAVRFGILLKQGPLLLGRAGDRVVAGVMGVDAIGAAADLVIGDLEPPPDQATGAAAGKRSRFHGVVSRGGARLVARGDNDDGLGLRIELSLFRTPASRKSAWPR